MPYLELKIAATQAQLRSLKSDLQTASEEVAAYAEAQDYEKYDAETCIDITHAFFKLECRFRAMRRAVETAELGTLRL